MGDFIRIETNRQLLCTLYTQKNISKTMQITLKTNVGMANLALAASFLLSGSALSAQQTITYIDGENRAAGIDSSAPNNPLILSVGDGSAATQSGAITGTGELTKVGNGSLTLSGANNYSGQTVVRNGTLAMTGSIAHPNSDMIVGSQSGDNGTLKISGAAMIFNREGFIGHEIASAGLVQVSGGSWTNSDELWVGDLGVGTLELSGTGEVYSDRGSIGRGEIPIGPSDPVSNYRGVVKVGGGSWTNTKDLAIGDFNQGLLEISGSGAVSNTYAKIGYLAPGRVRVSGGSWTNSGLLQVGFIGDGVLEISGTGTVSNTGAIIGAGQGRGTNVVNVSGGTWTNTGHLDMGEFANNTLVVSGTGRVIVSEIRMASEANSFRRGEGIGIIHLKGGQLTAGQVSKDIRAHNSVFNFDGGTLALSNDQAELFSGFRSGDVMLLAGGGTIDTQAFDVSSSQAFDGTGALTKAGTGSLTLSGMNTYTGATHVEHGSLHVEGMLASAVVTVGDGALLGGSGGLVGHVAVQDGGTLAPGGSRPGLLTVGSLDMESGSMTAMEISGSVPGTDHDQVIVNGTANLSGDLNLAFGDSELVNGQSFTLIDANEIEGDFETISYLFDKEIVFGSTITDDYTLNIIAISTDFAGLAGLNPELRQIASLLDGNFSDSGLIPIIDALNLLPEAEQAAAFQQISAPELTVLENFTFANSRLVSTRLKNRQRAVRQGVTGFSTAGFHLYNEDGQQIRDSLLADTSQTPPTGLQSQPLGSDPALSTYLSGSGTQRNLDSDHRGAGYEDDSFAILLGADYRWAENLAAGAYFGYNHTYADFEVDGSDADLDSFRMGFTGTYWNPLSDASAKILRSYYMTAHLGLADHEYEINRSAFGGITSGDADAFEIDLGTAIGYEVEFGGLGLTTEFSLDYINLNMEGYTESGSIAPLAISDDRSESLYSTLSLRLDYSSEYRGIGLLPYMHLGWRHEYLDNSNSVTARFSSSPTGAFTSEAATVDRDSFVGGLGLSAQLNEQLLIQLGYDGEMSSDFQSHSLFGAVNLKF